MLKDKMLNYKKMEKDNIIKIKTYEFALKIVLLYKDLLKEKEYILSKQLVRAATSVGANTEEAIQGQSKADFIHKFSIVQKEIFESSYWLRLLRDSNYLEVNTANKLIAEANEIERIVNAILKTAKQNKDEKH
jgi:four helix bundle protein